MELTLRPEVLRWARERAGYDVETLARKVQTSEKRVSGWEATGKLRPKQLEKLARVTHTPVGYLYLSSPPEEKLPVTDYRTVKDAAPSRPSPDLLEVIDQAQLRQDWFRDFLVSTGEEALDWVGSLTTGMDVIKAAAVVRARMDLGSELRSNASSWEEALRLQVAQIEEHGVMVMISGIVGNNTHRPLSVEEFRGFALSDRYAPLIFINGKDTKGAQMFTLIHELIHVWIGASGVSNLEKTYAEGSRVEQFCNRVAAELLVPADQLRAAWADAGRPLRLDRLTRRFKVSGVVVLRRLKDIELIGWETFNSEYRELQDRWRSLQEERGSGGDFYRTQGARTGRRFATALIESTLEGRTPYRDALRLLNLTKVDTFHKMARELRFSI